MRQQFRPLEKQIVAGVKRYLQYKENLGEIYFIRNNTGVIPLAYESKKTGVLKRRFANFGKTGSSDIVVFKKGGQALFLEVKREGGKANNNQIEFAKRIEALGYNYYIINNLDQVRELIP